MVRFVIAFGIQIKPSEGCAVCCDVNAQNRKLSTCLEFQGGVMKPLYVKKEKKKKRKKFQAHKLKIRMQKLILNSN